MAAEVEKKEVSEKEEAPSPTGASGKKKLLIIIAVALLIVGVGAPVGYFLLKKPQTAPDADEAVQEEQIEPISEEKQPHVVEQADHGVELEEGEELLGAIVPLDAFLVNLSGGKYIRLQVQAELETPDIPARFYSRIVPIRDQIITLLTQKTATELEESAGKEKLKTAIKDIINQSLRREDVRRIYFTQFVIQ